MSGVSILDGALPGAASERENGGGPVARRAHPGEAGVLLAMAEAVARRARALLIDAGNRSLGWAPLDEAVRRACVGHCTFAIEVKEDLLAVDLDLDVDAEARAVAFSRLVEAITLAGGEALVWASGRPGHRHLLVRMEAGPGRAGVEAWARAAGLDVRQVIRPPLAPHRSGLEVHLSSVHTPGAALDALAVMADPDAVLLALGRRRLSARMRAVLRRGHEVGGYPSASEGRMALALALRAADGSPGLLRALLGDAGNALGATFRARSARWQDQEVQRLWARAGDYLVARADAGSVELARVRGWCRALESGRWVGMGGASELALAEALGRRALEAGRCRVLCPLATAALGAGVSLATARRGLRRLVDKGWVVLAEAPGPTTASVWELRVPDGLEQLDVSTGDGPLAWEAKGGDLGADMARWRALGKSAVRVLRAMAAGGCDPVSLAARLGVGVSTIRSHLRRLVDAGLVRQLGASWEVRAYDAGAVARRFGTAGRRALDRVRYAEARLARRARHLAGTRPPHRVPHPTT